MEMDEKQLKEIIALAEICPEPYKVECFKLLLKYQLGEHLNKQSVFVNDTAQESDGIENTVDKKQREIVDSDLHLKFKKFMKDYGIEIERINQLFYFEEGAFLGMYDDLKSVKIAETQMRVALLHAMINAMNCGNFEFDGEAVRAECQKRKAYDQNYATNFKNNSSLFEGFVAYKKGISIKLSENGKNELSKVIEELSR